MALLAQVRRKTRPLTGPILKWRRRLTPTSRTIPSIGLTCKGMPRDRLERTVVLNEVRQLDRQQRMREGVMTRINANPELKQAYETLVKRRARRPARGGHDPDRPADAAHRCPLARPAPDQRRSRRRLKHPVKSS